MQWEHGATRLETGGWRFRLWAPETAEVRLQLLGPEERVVELEPRPDGYREATVADASPGMRYCYLVGGAALPDPASRFQPEGVHGPSALVDPRFPWGGDAGWRGLRLEQLVLYELHVGTYTREGTFDAVIPRLDELRELGVTAVELMPVAQFPGGRNWGYDGAYPFAAQNTYGGPAGLKRLVNACHARGLAVVLDVVYNHVGPEGNYLARFGPYFTERYRTPWGAALNFDGADSDAVRRLFVENALYWIADCHVDGLRLDAVHAIYDQSASPFLAELRAAVHQRGAELGRQTLVIAESDLNDSRLVRRPEAGGLGLDAQWSDDLHHALHALLTGERSGYYQDFGELGQLAKAYREGFVQTGEYSRYRRRRHGNATCGLDGERFVVFAQNHDQVGNRMQGERLSELCSYEQLKLAAGAVLLSPYVPLLFMGEEYGETAPFLFFVSHGDRELIAAVQAGRQREFAAFAWRGAPPDPQAEGTFARSKLHPELRQGEPHRSLRAFYSELIALRRELPAAARVSSARATVEAHERERVIVLRRGAGAAAALVLLCFAPAAVTLRLEAGGGGWRRRLDSSDARWLGPGAAPAWAGAEGEELRLNPHSVVVYRREPGEDCVRRDRATAPGGSASGEHGAGPDPSRERSTP